MCVHIGSAGGMVLATACGHQCCSWGAGSCTILAAGIKSSSSAAEWGLSK